MGHYLGLPSLVGRSKKVVFSFLKERMRKRIKGWSVKCLSRAGKAVLLRNVAQAIPSYTMSCFLLPKSLCQELQRMMNSFWWGSGNNTSRGIRWMIWENMSMSKSKGGLGFRDLHGFNLVLLGKHCWNFLKNPDTLVTRIFKARYFPNNTFLNDTCGGGASFIWSGICQAKEVLKKGFEWVLGDGKSIAVFADAWLRGKNEFRVDNNNGNRDINLTANDLFIPGTKMWDHQKVYGLFPSQDAEAILATPIPQNQVGYRPAWLHYVDGKYSVKTGYNFWHNNMAANITRGLGWNQLWKMEVPQKVKIFLWRFCRNNIPVRNILRGKGVQTPIICPMCGVGIEHLLHVFFDCEYSKRCWDVVGLHYDMSCVEYAPDWLLQKLGCESQEDRGRIGKVLWGVWSARNLRVWDNKNVTPALVMEWSTKQISEWQDARKRNLKVMHRGRQNVLQSKLSWIAPAQGKLKLNVDVSVYPGQSSFSLGMILRDHVGTFIKARTVKRLGEIPVFEAEAWGVFEALSWLQIMSMENVEIESDSLLVVNALKKKEEYCLEVDFVLRDCISVLQSRPYVSDLFVKKHVNKAAHLLARVPCMVNSFIDFLSPPLVVLETLVVDSIKH